MQFAWCCHDLPNLQPLGTGLHRPDAADDPALAIEPIASEGNPDWSGPYEKAPLPIYPNQSDLESDK
jgi:hypothetical protein